MADELKDQRIPIMMSPSEVKAIDDWMFANRIKSRAQAIRRLCQMGLAFDADLSKILDIHEDNLKVSLNATKLGLNEIRKQSTQERLNFLVDIYTKYLQNTMLMDDLLKEFEYIVHLYRSFSHEDIETISAISTVKDVYAEIMRENVKPSDI